MGADGSKQLSNAHGTYTAQDAELFDAACDNDEGRIMELLASGANPDSYRHQVRGVTAFVEACRRGHKGCAQALANAGADTSISASVRSEWEKYGLGPVPVCSAAAKAAKPSTVTSLSELGQPPQHSAPIPTKSQLAQQLSPPAASGARMLPPLPSSPFSGRTLATSNFKVAYEKAVPPTTLMTLGVKLGDVIRHFCGKQKIEFDNDVGERFLELLQSEMAEEDSIEQAVQRMWTSFQTLKGHEVCFMLNGVTRDDPKDVIASAASLTRAINRMCVTADLGASAAVHPPDNVCYRGGGFDDRYRDFFAAGREFRQPVFLATSFLEPTARRFIQMRGGKNCVLWMVHIDPERKCRHVNLVTRRVKNLEDEQEYLFAPYSAFTVLGASWNAGTAVDPHVIKLLAAVDNKEAAEDLPLAPWS